MNWVNDELWSVTLPSPDSGQEGMEALDWTYQHSAGGKREEGSSWAMKTGHAETYETSMH